MSSAARVMTKQFGMPPASTDMYQSFIGLEIHIRLNTKTKIFCQCKAHYGDDPNTNICPVCMGYPGALPSLNEEVMRLGYAVAKALNCSLADKCSFERKNYFYPDLPKNYQISQFAHPVGTNGWLEIETGGQRKKVRIHECHLEEDAGKMIHAGDMSLLDYNRTGIPLLEIVTEPDLSTGEEAEALLHELRRIVRHLGVCDGNMDEGSLKADANVSINLVGKGLGRKVEIKNLNSSRFVRKGLTYEIERQAVVLDKGGTIQQETRLWNENRDQTEVMRTKENANDYRYFPEPDLPPFKTSPEFIKGLDALMIELPIERRSRFVRDYKVSVEQAAFLCEERAEADYFEAVVKMGADPVAAATWLGSDVQKQLNRLNLSVTKSPLSVERFAALLAALAKERISGKIAKQVLELIFDENKDVEAIIKEKGLEKISDPAVIGAAVDKVLAANAKAVGEVKAGDAKPMGFLVGQIMKETGGKADPAVINTVLADKLKN
jgi:aspartyl-tRNA(Asn)/glutamyl-tRNA(Gln) amidotransferase subunit B